MRAAIPEVATRFCNVPSISITKDLRLSYNSQKVALVELLVLCACYLSYCTAAGSCDVVGHLHGFYYKEDIALLDGLTLADLDFDDDAGERSLDLCACYCYGSCCCGGGCCGGGGRGRSSCGSGGRGCYGCVTDIDENCLALLDFVLVVLAV